MQLCRYSTPIELPNTKVPTIYLDPRLPIQLNMLCLHLANTLIVQLPDPNKPYLLFTDASKYCYSGVLTQAPTGKSNEALEQVLTKNDSLISIYS